METDVKRKRPDFIRNLMENTPRHEPEVEEAEKSLKEIRGAIPTPMLDIVLRNGRVRSFSYAYLSEVEFEPGDTLTLTFTTGARVVAEGRGLTKLRQSVRLHRADEIQECPHHDLAREEEGLSQVEEIRITEGNEQ